MTTRNDRDDRTPTAGEEEPPPRPQFERLLPSRPLPAYRYVLGRSPHPTRDPAGHSYTGLPEPPIAPAPPAARWVEDAEYLYGIDLFNRGYFWEAHEAWERSWRGAAEDPIQREFLQALIQAAAACLQKRAGKVSGAGRLAQRALARLGQVAERANLCMGLAPAALARALESHIIADGPFPFLEPAP